MSVFDNVAFPLRVRKMSASDIRTKVMAALELVQLGGFEQRRPSQLSGGQQQRVALARAFVFEPDILLLDEPLGALDRKLREELQVELKQLQRRLGVTSILVTHDQEEALSLSDRVVVLDRGQVQQNAAPQEAYLRPANRFVADFLGIANFIDLPGGRTGVIRPERIRLAEAGAGGTQARVVEAVYLGQAIRYHLSAVEGGQAFVAGAPFIGRPFAVGQTVSLVWDDEDVWPVA